MMLYKATCHPRIWVASGLKKVQWTFLASSLRQQGQGVTVLSVGSFFIAKDLVYSLINRESGNLTRCILLELNISKLHSLDSLI